MGSTRVWIGGIASILYVFAMVVIAISRWHELRDLDLNELGDFLAGVFGPLAILWLVLGYFQQGEELKQNTEALHLQADELKRSVAQQEALVLVAKQQMDEARRIERDAKFPRFELTTEGLAGLPDIASQLIHVRNVGASANQVKVEWQLVPGPAYHDLGQIARYGETSFPVDLPRGQVQLGHTEVSFRCSIATGDVYFLKYSAKYVPDADGLATLVIINDVPTLKKA